MRVACVSGLRVMRVIRFEVCVCGGGFFGCSCVQGKRLLVVEVVGC